MLDITAYEDDGLAWSIPAATRIDTVLDRGANNRPLKRDTGIWANNLCIRPPIPIPGPKLVARSQRFNGRPAMFADFIAKEGPWDKVYSMLSPVADPRDKNLWFSPPHGYDTPYWGAILCRPPNGEDWFGAWDACNGESGTAATIGHAVNPKKEKRCWGVTTSVWLGDPWPSTDIEGSDQQTVLVIVKVDGASSFMELTWRDFNGDLQTDRTNFTLKNYPAKEIFFGFVHGSYLSVAGLKTGAPTEAEIAAVRNWSAPWLPATGFLPEEP
jgi:hypothetical protein